jgi:hypothetical protein
MLKKTTVLLAVLAFPAFGATCGDTSSGFDAWKSNIAAEAAAEGVGQQGLAALQAASYSKATISADRNQKSFKYTLGLKAGLPSVFRVAISKPNLSSSNCSTNTSTKRTEFSLSINSSMLRI